MHGISNISFYPVIWEVENCIMFFYQFPATCPTIQKIELYMDRKFYNFQLIFLTYFKCMLVAISWVGQAQAINNCQSTPAPSHSLFNFSLAVFGVSTHCPPFSTFLSVLFLVLWLFDFQSFLTVPPPLMANINLLEKAIPAVTTSSQALTFASSKLRPTESTYY